MAKESFSVDGLDELNRKLLQLDAKTGVATLRKAARKAMKPVEQAMREGAREDSGALKESIGMRARAGSRSDRRRVVTIAVGPVKKSAGRGESKRELENINQKAIAQEYGNAKQSAKPFIRPALDNNKNDVLDTLKTEFKNELERLSRA